MHLVLFTVPAFFVLLYVLFIHRTSKAWQSVPTFAPENNYRPHHFVSVLIPFRNELNNLPALVNDLKSQLFPKDMVEFIFINDHSDDGGDNVLRESLTDFPNAKLIALKDKNGKKQALQHGLMESKGKLIVTIDADVRLHKEWLLHVEAFHHLQEPALTVLPVQMMEERKYWKKLVRLEWMSLMALTGGSAERQRALMCNGANLSMERDALLSIGGFTAHQHISSGDDMFALVAMKRLGPNCVKYLLSTEATALVKMPFSFSAFIAQRVRWASKTRKAHDIHILIAGVILLLGNLGLIAVFVISFFIPQLWVFALFLFGLKLTVDFAPIKRTAKRMDEIVLERDVIVLSIIYPFYLIIIPVISLFYKPKWKGRTIEV